MLGIVTGSTLTGRIVSRTGRPAEMPIAGLSISCAALILLCVLPPGAELIALLGALCGFGFGTVMPTAQIISQTLAGRERLGAAASAVSLSRYTGAALGTAVFGAVVFALAPDSSGRIGFGALALVAAAGAWCASRMERIRL
jgi:MFS family permease